jgi:hypothetical protein
VTVKETIIPLAVLYGCKTWSLALQEEHRLSVSENRVLMKIFGPKREELLGGWRRLHNDELHNLYASPYIIRVRWGGTCSRHGGEMRNANGILIGKL